MPLPDAKPDRRIYELLKTTDLENLTFSDFQGVAEKVYAEQGAEDELRRIVLVNLARLACVGEWTGLTDAGGGGEFNVELIKDISGSYLRHTISNYPPWGSNTNANNQIDSINTPEFYPFISPASGDLTEMGIYVNSAASNTLRVGIYNTDDDDGTPTTLIGYADFDTSGGTATYQTSLSATITLTRGTQYWCGWVRTDSSTSPGVRGASNSASYFLGPSANASNAPNQQSTLVLSGSNNALPATVTATNLTPTYGIKLRLTLKF